MNMLHNLLALATCFLNANELAGKFLNKICALNTQNVHSTKPPLRNPLTTFKLHASKEHLVVIL